MNSVSVPGQPVFADKPTYAVRPAEVLRDEPVIIGLWRAGGLGEHQDDSWIKARYRWFYRINPQGDARLNLLWSDRESEPVGFLAIGARRFMVNGQDVAAGVLVDFVVAPRHRFVLPALTLQRDARQQAIETVPLIYGLPDTKAVALCKRLPTDVSFGLKRWVRVVRSRIYLDRMLPRVAAGLLSALTDALNRVAARLQLLFCKMVGEWVEQFDDSFDELWNSFPKSQVCVGIRDRRFLQWRFCDKPGPAPLIYAIRDRDTRALRMYFVCELRDNFLSVKDCLHAGSETDLKRGLLMLAVAARRLGANAVSIEIAASAAVRRALRRAQYVRRSERPFFAVLHPSTAAAAKACDWFITQADEDV
jgi:hypothetical protein